MICDYRFVKMWGALLNDYKLPSRLVTIGRYLSKSKPVPTYLYRHRNVKLLSSVNICVYIWQKIRSDGHHVVI